MCWNWSTHLARTLKTALLRWHASMPYTIRFSGCKIGEFLKIFWHFSEMRRLGYLKPALCKGSRSELFTNHLPLTGMETLGWRHLAYLQICPFTNHLPLTGMETMRCQLWQYRLKCFTNHLPLTGMETCMRKQVATSCRACWLYKPLTPNGDGNGVFAAQPVVDTTTLQTTYP